MRFYPGSKIVTSGETDEVVSANLRTADAPDKVREFYEGEPGAKATGDATILPDFRTERHSRSMIAINNDGNTNVDHGQRK